VRGSDLRHDLAAGPPATPLRGILARPDHHVRGTAWRKPAYMSCRHAEAQIIVPSIQGARSMHPITILMFFTLAIVLVIAGWAYKSTVNKQKNPNKDSGIGGPNDPMA